MDSIIEKNVQEEIFLDECEYFFSFLTDRFELATEMWKKELEKKFNKKFKPIWILSAKQNKFFQKDNYIILSKKLKELCSLYGNGELIYLQDYGDLNKEFSESEYIQDLIERLIDKQDRVFLLGFTTSCLDIKNPKVKLLGPDPNVSTKFDNKVEHIKLFEKLDVPRNKTKIYKSIEEIKNNEQYPFFISASYTSGGHESNFIYEEKDLDIFYSNLRDINKKNSFLVAKLIKDISSSPNVNAIITGENKTSVICITDQILRKNEYLGNIYPSKIKEDIKKQIIETTKIIGNSLSTLGFRGLFGFDFIVDSKDNLYTIDLNPRRQGGYLCNVLMSKNINIIEQELKLALGEEIPQFNYEEFQGEFAWAHSKVKPYYKNTQVIKSFCEGNPKDPFSEIGSSYRCIFYSEDSILLEGNGGYIMLSGKDHKEVKENIIKQTEIAISKNFELYEGIEENSHSDK